MLHAAEMGAIDLIVTKEVSRFARNTVDALQITRDLLKRKVGVLFLSDNIDTRDDDINLRLAMMSTFAEEESRKTSKRSKWGQMRSMEQGVVFGGSLLGYDVVGGKMSINPEGAEIVRLIFHKYLQERRGAAPSQRNCGGRHSQQQGQLFMVVGHGDKILKTRNTVAI
ncbi:MAG: recombinase family protein [Hydrogeniiclostridium mannosilyticum]